MAKNKNHGKKPSPKKVRRNEKRDTLVKSLRHYVRTQGVSFLEDPNITSIGIGYKMTDKRRTRKLCLQFTVGEKGGSAIEALDSREIPKTLMVASEEIPTDVMQRTFHPAFQLETLETSNPRKTRQNPLLPGISVSHRDGSAGTLGLVVFDRQSGDPCMLSNWHVLHGFSGEVGDPIVQPGPHDDNNADFNHAGVLLRSHLGHAGDCAIARIEDRAFEQEIFALSVTPSQIVRVDLGDVVIKSGRTTGVTRGVVRRTDVIAVINYSGQGPTEIGGFEIGPEEDTPPDLEVSMGGDSGSAWLIANEDGSASDRLAGLHFAGETPGNPDEHALACYAHSVLDKLDISLAAPAEVTVSELGYDPRFLTEEVSLPVLSGDQLEDAVLHNGTHALPYTHFSLCQSKARGLARFVAWNIDGQRIRRVSRSGIRFRLDPRIDRQFQHGNELYRSNPLDRGHIARRADLTWGSESEADRANRDSFFYSNIAPQHQAFNQSSRGGLWGELENAVFSGVDVEGLRVSLISGPIFNCNDPEHRGVQIPRSFWKLIAYRDTADDRFKIRAFVLTQRDLVSDIEALELDPFRVFQVSLANLEAETGLSFSSLAGFDTFDQKQTPETLAAEAGQQRSVREVRTAGGFFR